MTIEYTIVPADYGAYARYAVAKEPTFRTAARNAQLGFAIVLLLGTVTLMTLAQVQLSAISWLAVGIYVVFAALLTWHQRFEYRKRLQSAFARASRLCINHPHTIEADTGGLRTHCVITDCRISWTGVRDVAETPKHVFVFLQTGSAFIVPRDRVTQGDLNAFVGVVRTSLAGRGA